MDNPALLILCSFIIIIVVVLSCFVQFLPFCTPSPCKIILHNMLRWSMSLIGSIAQHWLFGGASCHISTVLLQIWNSLPDDTVSQILCCAILTPISVTHFQVLISYILTVLMSLFYDFTGPHNVGHSKYSGIEFQQFSKQFLFTKCCFCLLSISFVYMQFLN